MSEYLPEPLRIDILLRLPVETLIRCTSVCKSWYTLITSPTFISQHILTTTANNNNKNTLLLVRDYSKNSKQEHYSLHFDGTSTTLNSTFIPYKTLDFPFKSHNQYFRVIGSSNGLLCLSDDLLSYVHLTILWNPSIRKSVTLPRPRVTFNTHGPFTQSIGFGFDAANNDYKVVRVVYLEDLVGYVYKVPPEVELYELSTGSWRCVDPNGFPYVIKERSPQAFLNGVAHWVGCDPNQVGGSFFNLIVSFDMGNEEFGVIMVPDSVANEHWLRNHVAVLGDLLSLIQITTTGDERICCVWVMEQYGVRESWTKHFTVDLKQGLRAAFGFRSNGEALMTAIFGYSDDVNLVSYDPKSKQVKDLGIQGGPGSLWGMGDSFFVDNFVETLVLLDRVNGELGRRRNFGNTVTSEASEFGTRKMKRKRRKCRKNKRLMHSSMEVANLEKRGRS